MTLRIASFTSIPPRFSELANICECLKRQSIGFDHIILNIPSRYRRFPDWDGRLPRVPPRIEINHGCDDYGPATKVLPVASLFAQTDAHIFYCDDDRDLHDTYVARFFDGLDAKPNAVIAASTPPVSQFGVSWSCAYPKPHAEFKRAKRTVGYKARRLFDLLCGRTGSSQYQKPFRTPYYTEGYGDLAEGLAGVLCHSRHFDKTAFDVPESCWFTDDIWLSATFARRGAPIWNPGNVFWPPTFRSDAIAPLHGLNVNGANQFVAHQRAVEHVQAAFGVWSKPEQRVH